MKFVHVPMWHVTASDKFILYVAYLFLTVIWQIYMLCV